MGKRAVDLWTYVETKLDYVASWVLLVGPFDSLVSVVWSFLRHLLTGRGKSSEISLVN